MESVMAKEVNKRARRYPVGFQRDAVERMKHCENIGELAEELGVSRGALYLWKRRGEGLPSYRDAARQGHPAAEDDPPAKKKI
jgi:transposase